MYRVAIFHLKYSTLSRENKFLRIFPFWTLEFIYLSSWNENAKKYVSSAIKLLSW